MKMMLEIFFQGFDDYFFIEKQISPEKYTNYYDR